VHLETALSLSERFYCKQQSTAFLGGTLSWSTFKQRFPWQNAFKVHLESALFVTERFHCKQQSTPSSQTTSLIVKIKVINRINHG
jgi:hypothetical protein